MRNLVRRPLPLVALLAPLALVACASVAVPPPAPPALTEPPAVATKGFLTAYTEQTVPMSVPELRAFMRERPVIEFLQPTDNIANPVEAKVLAGTWGEPGAARWLRLADGHYVVERILENEPDLFRYQVFTFTNATGRGVEQIVGEQRFVPVEDGTQFQWTYNVKPRNVVTRQVVRGSMDEIEGYIAGGLAGFAEAARAAKAGG